MSKYDTTASDPDAYARGGFLPVCCCGVSGKAACHGPLKWSGSSFKFWESYDFSKKQSLISRDFVRSKMEEQVRHPDGSLVPDVTLLAQDSGEKATGMQ